MGSPVSGRERPRLCKAAGAGEDVEEPESEPRGWDSEACAHGTGVRREL